MGWFSNLTNSLGGGVSDLLGGILSPVADTANSFMNGLGGSGVLDTSGANSFLGGLGGGLGGGGLGGAGGGLFGGGLGGIMTAGGEPKNDTAPPDATGESWFAKNKTGVIIGSIVLVLGTIAAFVFGRKNNRR